mmetsp:Transcript_60038/g.168270  ORF Transcript_60038/g.168270 Transcript_60038/m.168270 type:complete len:269 (-) Transcript_60038:120-926(-)
MWNDRQGLGLVARAVVAAGRVFRIPEMAQNVLRHLHVLNMSGPPWVMAWRRRLWAAARQQHRDKDVLQVVVVEHAFAGGAGLQQRRHLHAAPAARRLRPLGRLRRDLLARLSWMPACDVSRRRPTVAEVAHGLDGVGDIPDHARRAQGPASIAGLIAVRPLARGVDAAELEELGGEVVDRLKDLLDEKLAEGFAEVRAHGRLRTRRCRALLPASPRTLLLLNRPQPGNTARFGAAALLATARRPRAALRQRGPPHPKGQRQPREGQEV